MNNNTISPNILNKEQPNSILTNKSNNNPASNLTLNDLAKLVIFKFGSIADFGRKLGVTRSRASQILTGVDLPKTPDYIKRIADILGIDSVVLTMCFSNADNKNREVQNGE